MAKNHKDVIDADIAKGEEKTPGQTPPATSDKKGEAPTSGPPEGATSVAEDAFFEGEILAYRELNQIAKAIAKLIATKQFRKLITYDKRDVEALPALAAFYAQAGLIRDQYGEISAAPTDKDVKAVPAGLTTATTLANAFLGFLALFRSDVQVHGREITLDEAALIAELTDRLQGTASVIYPSVGPVLASKKIGTLLQELAKAKADARQRAHGDASLEKRADIIDSQLDSFRQSLMKQDATSGATLLATLARAEALQGALEDGQILFVKIVRAGAGRRLIENFWTRTFYSDRISHSGGAVVTFMVLDKTGTILLSRTLYSHSGYTKFNQGNPLHEDGRNFEV